MGDRFGERDEEGVEIHSVKADQNLSLANILSIRSGKLEEVFYDGKKHKVRKGGDADSYFFHDNLGMRVIYISVEADDKQGITKVIVDGKLVYSSDMVAETN